jgi:transcriptional regulator with XRE-family HTH domain
MTGVERKAAFKYAATVRKVTMANAARRLGVSYNHLMLVLAGEEEEGRKGSAALLERIADFLGCSVAEAFPKPLQVSIPAPKGDITLN